MASDHDKCQEDKWTGDVSDRAGDGEKRSSEETGMPFANELTFELRCKGRKAVSCENMHHKLWKVQVQRPWGRNKCVLFEEDEEAKWPKGRIKGGSWRDRVKEALPMPPLLEHGKEVKPHRANWAAQSHTASYCYSSFFCPQIQRFF